MRPTPFHKYEGTANDFLVVEHDDDLDPTVVASLCDRHRGVGGDGVLLVRMPTPGRPPRMIVRNSDGSRPEMCGNGVRCVALHLARHHAHHAGHAATSAFEITIDTDAGPRTCLVEPTHDGEAAEVTVDMGIVKVVDRVTVEHDWPGAGRRSVELVRADAGNPHAILLEPMDDAAFDDLGARLQHHPAFPHGVNLERVVDAGDLADTVVFERGVGRTMACGTGACAVAAVLVAEGRRPPGAPVRVRLPGGVLRLSLEAAPATSVLAASRVRMRGPARHVFSGTVVIPSVGAREGAAS